LIGLDQQISATGVCFLKRIPRINRFIFSVYYFYLGCMRKIYGFASVRDRFVFGLTAMKSENHFLGRTCRTMWDALVFREQCHNVKKIRRVPEAARQMMERRKALHK
jgi:hypothetical protein